MVTNWTMFSCECVWGLSPESMTSVPTSEAFLKGPFKYRHYMTSIRNFRWLEHLIEGTFLVFNHLGKWTSLIDYWIWCGYALIAYLDDCDLGN